MDGNRIGEAIITCMGMIGGGGGRMHGQEKLKKKEMKTMEDLKNEKGAGVYWITAEMLKYKRKTVIERMHKIYGSAWEEGRVSGGWTKAIIIPAYKWSGSKN